MIYQQAMVWLPMMVFLGLTKTCQNSNLFRTQINGGARADNTRVAIPLRLQN